MRKQRTEDVREQPRPALGVKWGYTERLIQHSLHSFRCRSLWSVNTNESSHWQPRMANPHTTLPFGTTSSRRGETQDSSLDTCPLHLSLDDGFLDETRVLYFLSVIRQNLVVLTPPYLLYFSWLRPQSLSSRVSRDGTWSIPYGRLSDSRRTTGQ